VAAAPGAVGPPGPRTRAGRRGDSEGPAAPEGGASGPGAAVRPPRLRAPDALEVQGAGVDDPEPTPVREREPGGAGQDVDGGPTVRAARREEDDPGPGFEGPVLEGEAVAGAIGVEAVTGAIEEGVHGRSLCAGAIGLTSDQL
jgi:hypothetical protein